MPGKIFHLDFLFAIRQVEKVPARYLLFCCHLSSGKQEVIMNQNETTSTQKLAIAGVLTAAAVAGSLISVPVAGSKCGGVSESRSVQV